MNEPRTKRRMIAALMVGGAVAATSMLGTTETRAVPPTRAVVLKPDLVVTAAGIGIKRGIDDAFYGFGGETVRFAWHHRTENTGKGAAARPSRTAVQLLAGDDWIQPASLPVPALGSGKSAAGEGEFNRKLAGPLWDYGTYPTRVCADAFNTVRNETNGTNNCHGSHPIFVVPSEFKGEINGTANIPMFWPGVKLSWTGTLTFKALPKTESAKSLANRGGFDYEYADGELSYTLSDGELCTWSGSGTYTPSKTDAIQLNFSAGPHHYEASLIVRPRFNFPATMNCPGQPPEQLVGGFHPIRWAGGWLITGEQRFPDPGLTELSGSLSTGDPRTGSLTVRWDLPAFPRRGQ
jgi:hypothetical protein